MRGDSLAWTDANDPKQNKVWLTCESQAPENFALRTDHPQLAYGKPKDGASSPSVWMRSLAR